MAAILRNLGAVGGETIEPSTGDASRHPFLDGQEAASWRAGGCIVAALACIVAGGCQY